MCRTEERNRLIASHQSASDAFDRALLTLSAGSLGLSIAVVRDIASKPTATWLLKTSWILMGFALVLILGSFLLSVHIHERLIESLGKEEDSEEQPRWARKGVTYLNWSATITFVTGAAFLIVFAMKNF